MRCYFLDQRAEENRKSNTTTDSENNQEKAMFMNVSSPECVTWLTLGVTESAVVIAGNLITIVVFMKNNYLLKIILYLVINLTVADMLAGGIFIAQIFFTLGSHCKFSEFNLGSYRRAVPLYFAIYFLIYLFPLTSLTNIAMISLQQAHATFRPFKHRVIKKWVYGVAIVCSSRKRGHIIFTYGNHTTVCVYLSSVFLTLLSLLNFVVERVLRTMVQLEDKENLL